MELLPVIIECPRGTGEKYDYVPEKGYFKLSKVLPAGLVFPFDFGFVPETRGEDGDPLDVIVISGIQSFTGCCMDCRIIGAIKAQQTELDGSSMRNDRFFAIPDVSEVFKDVRSISDLPEDIVAGVEEFFQTYNEQAGKKFEVLERIGADDAYKLISKQHAEVEE